MRPKCLAAGLLSLAIGSIAYGQAKSPTTTPNERKDKGAVARHEKFLDRAKMGNVDLLFLGDSITQGWEGNGKEVWAKNFEALKAANFGIGGDRTEHVLWRITEGKELDGISPKVLVLMIGTNNSSANTADQIAEGVEAIVKELRHQKPHMKVLVLAVFPRSGKNAKQLKDPNRAAKDELNSKLPEVNKRIAKLDDGKMIKFLDIGPKFLDKEGGLSKEIMPDYLHLSKKGYEIWAEAIGDTVKEMLK